MASVSTHLSNDPSVLQILKGTPSVGSRVSAAVIGHSSSIRYADHPPKGFDDRNDHPSLFLSPEPNSFNEHGYGLPTMQNQHSGKAKHIFNERNRRVP
jgi:hypothetical protein